MENRLQQLFDYQKFAKEPTLEKLIRETEERFSRALSDDDLDMVYAAGENTDCHCASSDANEHGE